jgi:hypothetical protein
MLGVCRRVIIYKNIYGITSKSSGLIFTLMNSDASLKLVFMKTKIDEALSGHLSIIQWKRFINPSRNKIEVAPM